MTRYTDKEIRKMAMAEVKDMKKKTGHDAKLHHWELIIGDHITLAVIVHAYDGLRQVNIAI